MLAERINAVAPDMSSDIRRWFLERDYAKPSLENQDWDLSLAEWDFVPLLIEYTEDQANLLDKRFMAFSALMVLHGFDGNESEGERRRQLYREIERIVLENREFARQVSDGCLGLIEALIIKRILGEEIPEDVPQWMREEVTRRAHAEQGNRVEGSIIPAVDPPLLLGEGGVRMAESDWAGENSTKMLPKRIESKRIFITANATAVGIALAAASVNVLVGPFDPTMWLLPVFILVFAAITYVLVPAARDVANRPLVTNWMAKRLMSKQERYLLHLLQPLFPWVIYITSLLFWYFVPLFFLFVSTLLLIGAIRGQINPG